MKPSNATILVVDDDDTLREAIVFELNRRHFKTREAANGNDALNIVKTCKIHLVVSDVKMPGGDGIELLKKLREIDPSLPVLIFISGFCDLLPADAISMGARRFFEKPFNRAEFMTEVENSIAEIQELV